MRGNFKLYGCAVHVDLEKKNLDSFEWPYISIVVVDGNGCPICVDDGIACVETKDAYIFAVKGMLGMTPRDCQMISYCVC